MKDCCILAQVNSATLLQWEDPFNGLRWNGLNSKFYHIHPCGKSLLFLIWVSAFWLTVFCSDVSTAAPTLSCPSWSNTSCVSFWAFVSEIHSESTLLGERLLWSEEPTCSSRHTTYHLAEDDTAGCVCVYAEEFSIVSISRKVSKLVEQH